MNKKLDLKIYFNAFRDYFKAILKLTSKKFALQILGSVFFGICGFFSEIGLSVMLTSILVVIGLISDDKLPGYIKNLNLSGGGVFILTCLFIFMKAGIQFWKVLIYGIIFFDFKRINEQKMVAMAITDSTHAPISGAYVSSVIANIIPRGGNVMRNIAEILYHVVMVIPMIGFLIYLNLQLTVLSFASFGLIAILSVWINRHILNLGKKINPIFGSFTETYLRSIRNRILLRIYGTTENEVLEAMKLSQQFRNKNVMSIKWQAAASIPSSLIAPVWLFVILWASTSYFTISQGMLLSFFYIFMRLAAYLTNLGSSLSTMIVDLPAIYELATSLCVSQNLSRFDKSIEYEHKDLKEVLSDADTKYAEESKIMPVQVEIQQLSANYNGKPVFQNLNCLLPAGNCLGIIGHSGSGKSTLIAIIVGLMQPNEGRVLIDNMHPGHAQFASFRRNIGYVGPEPLLKQGTIYENLLYGLNKPVEKDKIFKVMEDVQLGEILQSEMKGLEWKVYEGGEGLSSGQKQRLCLARALLRDPRLLILDEATANLDEKTEKFIIEYLRKLKGSMTMIIATHRPQPIKLADQIIDLGTSANKRFN